MKRRDFLVTAGGCAAHLLSLSCVSPALGRSVFAPRQDDNVVATENWGRLEEIAEGIWAHIATPFENNDFTTVANGGIIAGEKRILAIEAFMQPAGAKWMAERCKVLTGRWPTDIVVTHFHGDHTSGHSGYIAEDSSPSLWITEPTKVAAEKSFGEKETDAPPVFENVQLLNAEEPTEMDLGGRMITITPRAGHTSNDLTIEITDPKVIWTGDLYFNRMFPNYGDSFPKKLNEYAASLTQLENDVVIVPGHGPLADSESAKIYVDFLGYVQIAAEKAIAAGGDLDTAAGEFKLPERLKNWMVWSPENAQKAFAAWKRASD